MASSMRAAVPRVARHGAIHHQPFEGEVLRAVGDAAWARPHAEDAAEARGDAQTAAEVRAGGEPDLARGECHRRAAGGAPAGLIDVPRVSGLAEDLVEGVGAGAELGRVGLGDHDGASGLQRLDQDVRARRHMVGIDRRAPGRAHALDLHQVLDRDGQAAEPAARAVRVRRLRHDPLGMGARPLDAERRQGVEMPVGGCNPLGAGLHHLQRRDLSAPQQVHGLGRAETPEIAAAHHDAVPPQAAGGRRVCQSVSCW